MGCLLLLIGLVFPRVALALLLLLTTYLERAYGGVLLPLLGLIFLPYTCLWYAIVEVSLDGRWNILSVALMVLAVAFDLSAYVDGGWRFGSRRRVRVIEESV